MVISYSTSLKVDKTCIWVKYFIYAVLSRFQICTNLLVFFCLIFIHKISEFTQKFLSYSGKLQLQIKGMNVLSFRKSLTNTKLYVECDLKHVWHCIFSLPMFSSFLSSPFFFWRRMG